MNDPLNESLRIMNIQMISYPYFISYGWSLDILMNVTSKFQTIQSRCAETVIKLNDTLVFVSMFAMRWQNQKARRTVLTLQLKQRILVEIDKNILYIEISGKRKISKV